MGSLSAFTDICNRLRAHQVEPFKHLVEVLSQHQSAVDISDTGVGKTYVAAAVAKAIQLPTLVVCPKIVVSAWHRAATHFDDSLSVINYEKLRVCNTEYGGWENPRIRDEGRQDYFTCQCCQQRVDIANSGGCFAHPLGIHCLEKKTKTHRYGRFEFHDAIKFLVFDEVHRCGALDSLNAEILIAAKRQGIKVLGLSATAACNPLSMRALGYNLDLHNDKYDQLANAVVGQGMKVGAPFKIQVKPSFYKWLAKNGCRKIPPLPGIRWAVGAERQLEVMKDIRSQIIPARGVRVSVADIPGFPKRDIAAELYDIEDSNQINRFYQEMREAIGLLGRRCELDKAPESAITRLLRAKQRIELLKVPVASELAADYVAKGHSIGIFVNYRQTLEELQSRFTDAAVIFGGQSEVNRAIQIERFQSDATRIILIMSEAGGVGLSLPDTRGNFPRGGLVMPTDKAVTMRQIFGRFHRDDSVSNCFYRVLLAAGSIEQRMHRNLNQKLANLDALNDSDLRPIVCQ